MKNYFTFFLLFLLFIAACTKSDVITPTDSLESRGNDNHKIYKMAGTTGSWNYTLTDGSSGEGTFDDSYIFKCSSPIGRVIESSSLGIEDGHTFQEQASTMTYNNNGMIDVEHAIVNGDEITRKFNYDENGAWTGITTTINGAILDDEMEIDPYGQVLSYTADGVKSEYIWRGNNIKTIKTYIKPSTSLSVAKNSSFFDKLGFDARKNDVIRKSVLQELSKIQRNTSAFRSKNTEEWELVQIEEQEVDHKVVQPYSSVAKGYPGTVGDGGYLILPKNFITKVSVYAVNPDGSKADLIFLSHNHSYSIWNNLPQNVTYLSYIKAVFDDAEGNPVDWNETGSFSYDYISGCNETGNTSITK